MAPIMTPTRAAEAPAVHGEPIKVLDAMVNAYRDLRSLQQDTTYTVNGPLTTVSLLYERPNHLKLDMYKRNPRFVNPLLTRVLCDGKNTYTYLEQEQQYIKDKAPKDNKGFAGYAYSFEMAALAGEDPFAVLREGKPQMRMDKPAAVDGVETDVVVVDISSATSTGEMRFYIGQKDRLLRRFHIETKTIPPINTSPSGKTYQKHIPGQPDLADDNDIPTTAAILTSYGYDNQVVPNVKHPHDTFRWFAPPGTTLRENAAKKQGKRGGIDPNLTTPDGKPLKPIKIVPLKSFNKKR